jgi:hypothetical protein
MTSISSRSALQRKISEAAAEMILELDRTAVIAIAGADVDQRFMRGSSPNEALITLSHHHTLASGLLTRDHRLIGN